MQVSRTAPILVAVAVATLLSACGRSPTGDGSADKATEALETAQEARATGAGNTAAIAALDSRAAALESDTTDLDGRLGAVEADVTALDTQGQSHEARLVALEQGGAAGTDDGISVDDITAAGFVAGDNVTNVEEGFAVVNGELSTHDARIGVVESALGGDFSDTVVDIVNTEIAAGNIVADVDATFAPGVDVDPRADGSDAYPEYSASVSLQQAIMALRFANQVRYTAPATNTRLGELNDGTIRSYVQEAIGVLDADLYDVIAGNLSPALDTTDLPQTGEYDDVQRAIVSLHDRLTAVQAGADATLAAFVLATAQQAVVDGRPYILGPTTATSTGFLTNGTIHGIEGGTALCQAQFTTVTSAHMCNVDEARQALSQSRYDEANADLDGATAWVMADTEATSCEGLLSGEATANGTFLTVDLTYTSGAGNAGKVLFTASATCDTQHAVLCCR